LVELNPAIQSYVVENAKIEELDQNTWFVGISLFSCQRIALANHTRAHRLLRQLTA
jgi:hypothetical protein